MRRRALVTVSFACGFAVAISAGACSGRQSRRADETSDRPGLTAAKNGGTSANADQGPVTITGCLQKGDGGTFIVTAINSPRVSVGTSGSGASATAVEREQVRA